MPQEEGPFEELFKTYHHHGQEHTDRIEALLRKTLRAGPSFNNTCPQVIQQFNEILKQYLQTTMRSSGEPFKTTKMSILPKSLRYGLLRSINQANEEQLQELMLLRAKEDLYGKRNLDRLEANIQLVESMVWKTIYARSEAAFGNKNYRGTLIAQAIADTAQNWHESAITAAQLFFSEENPVYTYLFSEGLYAKKEQSNFINKNPYFTKKAKEASTKEWYQTLQQPFITFVTNKLGKQALYVLSDLVEAASTLVYKHGDTSFLPAATENHEELERIIGDNHKIRTSKRYRYVKERFTYAKEYAKAKHITTDDQRAAS